MRTKTVLAALLLVHLLAHPALHAFVLPDLAADQVLRQPEQDDGTPSRADNSPCYVCRTNHAVPAPMVLGGGPAPDAGCRLALSPALDEVFRSLPRLPARAPPAALITPR